MFPCDDKPGFNLCKTLSVYILTQHTIGCYETGHPLLRLCYTIEVSTFMHSVVSAAYVQLSFIEKYMLNKESDTRI